jgi:hypothetical protein
MATSSVVREEYHVSPRGVVHFSLPLLVHYCITGDNRPLTPKLNADPASAADIPKKNPLGAGAE